MNNYISFFNSNFFLEAQAFQNNAQAQLYQEEVGHNQSWDFECTDLCDNCEYEPNSVVQMHVSNESGQDQDMSSASPLAIFDLHVQYLKMICQKDFFPDTNDSFSDSVKFYLNDERGLYTLPVGELQRIFPHYQNVFIIKNGHLRVQLNENSSKELQEGYLEAGKYVLNYALQAEPYNIQHVNLSQMPFNEAITLLPYVLNLTIRLADCGLEQECASFIFMAVSNGFLKLADGIFFQGNLPICAEAWDLGLIQFNQNQPYLSKSVKEQRKLIEDIVLLVNHHHCQMSLFTKNLLRQALCLIAKNLQNQFSGLTKKEVEDLGAALVNLQISISELKQFFMPLLQEAYTLTGTRIESPSKMHMDNCYIYILAAYFCLLHQNNVIALKEKGFSWIAQLIEKYPANDRLWTINGEFHSFYGSTSELQSLKSKYMQRALECFNQAISLNADNDVALIKRAIIRGVSEQEIQLTLQDIREVFRINPQNDEAWTYQGCILQARQDNKKALESWDIALKINPHNYMARFKRGCLVQSQNPTLAFQDFEFLVANYPYDLNVRLAIAKICMSEKKYVLAINHLNVALKVSKLQRQALILRGECYRLNCEWKNALKDFNNLLNTDKNNWDLRAKRGRVYVASGRMSEARADLEAVLKIDAKHIECLIGLSEYHTAKKDSTQALKYFNQAISINPDQTIALIKKETNNSNEVDRINFDAFQQRVEKIRGSSNDLQPS